MGVGGQRQNGYGRYPRFDLTFRVSCIMRCAMLDYMQLIPHLRHIVTVNHVLLWCCGLRKKHHWKRFKTRRRAYKVQKFTIICVTGRYLVACIGSRVFCIFGVVCAYDEQCRNCHLQYNAPRGDYLGLYNKRHCYRAIVDLLLDYLPDPYFLCQTYAQDHSQQGRSVRLFRIFCVPKIGNCDRELTIERKVPK